MNISTTKILSWVLAKGRFKLSQPSIDEVVETVRGRELAPTACRVSIGVQRIVFVAPMFDYGRPENGFGIEETYFVDSLRQCGCSVIRFDSIGIVNRYGRRFAQDALLETVYREYPELVFCVLFKDEVEVETLRRIRDELGVPVVNWFCDDHWRFGVLATKIASALTCSITTHHDTLPRYETELSAKAVLSQWACNDRMYRPGPCREIDVLFVGQLYGERQRYLQRLIGDGISVTTFGNNTEGGRVTQRMLAQLLGKAKIVLNFSRGYDGATNQIKARIFEATGSGSCLVTERTDHLDEYFEEGRECFQFQSYDDLNQLVSNLLKDDSLRTRVATAGYRRTVDEHLYIHRFQELARQLKWGAGR